MPRIGMPSSSAAFDPSSRSRARYSGSVHAFATIRAPWPGLALSVLAIRSAISAGDAMPFAASTLRNAISSFSPSISARLIFAPANVRRFLLPTHRPHGLPAIPRAGRSAHDTAHTSEPDARTPGLPDWETPPAVVPPSPACRANNAACGCAPGHVSPASRPSPARWRQARTSFRLQCGAQLGLGDDALLQQNVSDRANPAAVVTQPVVLGLRNGFDAPPQLVHGHDLLRAEKLADRVHLLVEVRQAVRRGIHRLAHEFRSA